MCLFKFKLIKLNRMKISIPLSPIDTVAALLDNMDKKNSPHHRKFDLTAVEKIFFQKEGSELWVRSKLLLSY